MYYVCTVFADYWLPYGGSQDQVPLYPGTQSAAATSLTSTLMHLDATVYFCLIFTGLSPYVRTSLLSPFPLPPSLPFLTTFNEQSHDIFVSLA